ncbi:hypothetical protein [Paenibacillus sp. TSA_86.1]|uniref:hypothetical protein n=1 Tax=Paenibacillus sp. TSA_86.1 TaxID=3415649 RepID=UPI004045FFF4
MFSNDKVGLSQKKDAYPEQLSSGQQQHVAIARLLAMKKLNHEGIQMIVVTHYQNK